MLIMFRSLLRQTLKLSIRRLNVNEQYIESCFSTHTIAHLKNQFSLRVPANFTKNNLNFSTNTGSSNSKTHTDTGYEEEKKASSENHQIDLDDEFQSFIEEMKNDFGVDGGGRLHDDNQSKVQIDDENKSNVEDDRVSLDKNKSGSATSAPSVQDKYSAFDDYDAEIILDENEEYEILQKGEKSFYLYDKPTEDFSQLNLIRGVNGVFEVEELVGLLINENLQDICVIKVAKEYCYVDYLLISTVKSARHSTAVVEFLNKVYKRKRGNEDPFLKIEGKSNADWKAIDLGNIALHLFSEETRKYYDIETLWSVGREFDDLSNEKEDPMTKLIRQDSYFDEEIHVDKPFLS